MPLLANPYKRSEIRPGNWAVLCRTDRSDPEVPGKYTLATSDGFETREAALAYARSISPSRDPLVACLESLE